MTLLGTASIQAYPSPDVMTIGLQPVPGSPVDSGIVIPSSGGSTPTVPTTGITWPRTR